MRRLYQDAEGERLTPEGRELVTKLETFLRQVYAQASESGVSLRDVKIAMNGQLVS